MFVGDVEQVEGAEKITVKVFKSITLVHEAGMVLLEVGLCQNYSSHDAFDLSQIQYNNYWYVF